MWVGPASGVVCECAYCKGCWCFRVHFALHRRFRLAFIHCKPLVPDTTTRAPLLLPHSHGRASTSISPLTSDDLSWSSIRLIKDPLDSQQFLGSSAVPGLRLPSSFVRLFHLLGLASLSSCSSQLVAVWTAGDKESIQSYLKHVHHRMLLFYLRICS